tara:strand:+ start:694 stop:1743 length:1050 start_codon:yes stop_codon:yes gene_type:complete
MFEINGTKIGIGLKPYIIAELSANHGGDIQRAKDSIRGAKEAGANAVKLQTYTPDTMTLNSSKDDFLIKEGLWKGYNLYQLYKEAYTPYEWHKELFSFAELIGITIFSTPFDETAIDLLEDLNTPAYKIASFELTDLPLIEYAASKKKPMLISTGMGSFEEIKEAILTCNKQGNNDILLFHCISKYPAKEKDYQLGDIKFLREKFNLEVGLSDHTISNMASNLAISIGACAIEKHFKLDDKECGPDSSFSLNANKFRILVDECNLSFEASKINYLQRTESEKVNKKFRRSIYFIKELKKGHILKKEDIRRIRPGYGLEPKYFDEIVGMRLKKDVEKAEAVKWEYLEKTL